MKTFVLLALTLSLGGAAHAHVFNKKTLEVAQKTEAQKRALREQQRRNYESLWNGSIHTGGTLGPSRLTGKDVRFGGR